MSYGDDIIKNATLRFIIHISFYPISPLSVAASLRDKKIYFTPIPLIPVASDLHYGLEMIAARDKFSSPVPVPCEIIKNGDTMRLRLQKISKVQEKYFISRPGVTSTCHLNL